MSIQLAEFDAQGIVTDPIAQVFNQRFPCNAYAPKASDYTLNVTLEASQDFEHLDSSLSLTMDLTVMYESLTTPEKMWEYFGELTCEYEYYQSYGHPFGFGHFLFTVLIVDKPHAVHHDQPSNAQGESKEKRVGLKPGKPNWGYWLIYDALPYAASLIDRFNESYANLGEQFTFSAKIVSIE